MVGNIKLIAVDLDGTLLNSDGGMSENTRSVLQSLNDHNIKLVIATGRPLYLIKDIIDNLGLNQSNDYTIALNGAVIANNASESLQCVSRIDESIVHDIAQQAIELNLNDLVMFDCVNSSFDHIGIICKNKSDKNTKHFIDMLFDKKGVVNIFEYKPDLELSSISKIYLYGLKELIDKIYRKWKDKLEISYEDKKDFASLEITNLNVNKALGVKHLCKTYQIDPSEVMAIGNEQNDVSMIEWAGIGVAMDNAPLWVKEIADVVTDSNDDDGVANVIKEYVLVNYG